MLPAFTLAGWSSTHSWLYNLLECEAILREVCRCVSVHAEKHLRFMEHFIGNIPEWHGNGIEKRERKKKAHLGASGN